MSGTGRRETRSETARGSARGPAGRCAAGGRAARPGRSRRAHRPLAAVTPATCSRAAAAAARSVATRAAALLALSPLALPAATTALTVPSGPPRKLPETPALRFADITANSGVDFMHQNGATGVKYAMELIGPGGALIDYDGDGDLDLYLINGSRLPGTPASEPFVNALYENVGFPAERPVGDAYRPPYRRVSDAAGAADTSFGMGCTVGDYDNDGDPDLYVTNFGPNRLYRNDGGRFVDVASEAGVTEPRWSTAAAFVDIDHDGHLDLYVGNYFKYRIEDHAWYGTRKEGYRTHGGPAMFKPVYDSLFRSRGDGTFEDVSESSGILEGGETYALGVVAGDFDDDGDTDIYVANDTQANWLFLNDGTGKFVEEGMLSGVSYDQGGKPQSGMAAEAGDVNGDGLIDLLCTNFSMESNTLYVAEGGGFYADASYSAGLAEATLPLLTFGSVFADVDNDRDLDLFSVNGHITDVIELYYDHLTYKQHNQLFFNRGNAVFDEADASWGAIVTQVEASRAAIRGDLDDDGDPDFVVTNVAAPTQILRNIGGNANSWIRVQLAGTESNRDGFGADVWVTADGETRRYQARVAAGYLSSNDPRILAGLGAPDVPTVERVEVRWPSGTTDVIESVPARRTVLFTEGNGGEVLPEGLAAVGWAMQEGDW